MQRKFPKKKQKKYSGKSALSNRKDASQYHLSVGNILRKHFGINSIQQEVYIDGQYIDWILTTDDGLTIAIEVHGEQHYKAVDFGGNDASKAFESQQFRDRRKRLILAKRGIPLIEIPYWHAHDEEWILNEIEKRRRVD